jgi:hypothetical protein
MDMEADINCAQPSPRMRQDAMAETNTLPDRTATTGRMYLGYCLTIASPAIGWVLEDLGMLQISARMISLAVLVGGVLLTSVGTMARWGYNETSEHHFFGI